MPAKVLILDEPTSALGVRQSGIVLKYIVQARELGKGVIFITHNPHHAYPVGDRFYLLKRGRLIASVPKGETTIEGLTDMMAGGTELKELSRELLALTAGTSGAAASEFAEVARELAEEAPAGEAPDPALGAFPDSALLRAAPVGQARVDALAGRPGPLPAAAHATARATGRAVVPGDGSGDGLRQRLANPAGVRDDGRAARFGHPAIPDGFGGTDHVDLLAPFNG